MSRRLRIALVLAFVLGGVAEAVALRHPASSRLEVDYYYIPHCYSCAKVLKGLDGLADELGARVRVRTIDCFSNEGKAAAATYGFVTHGVVIHDSARGLVFEEKDHLVSADDVRAVLRRELAH